MTSDIKENDPDLLFKQELTINRRAEEMTRILLDFVPYPIMVSSIDGMVSYINPAFTLTFGWTIDDLRSEKIPYVPAELLAEARANNATLLQDRFQRLETKRLTKDGRVLDVIMKRSVYSKDLNGNDGQIVLLRDVTEEKKLARTKDTLFRISMALPEYPDLEDLLEYITNEIKTLLNAGSAAVLIPDEVKDEIFFLASGYDADTKSRIKRIRVPVGQSVTGRVIKTGIPIIIPDTSKVPDFYSGVEQEAKIETRSMMTVPLRSRDRIIGALSAVNKMDGVFDETDLELLSMIAATVVLSIENARYSDELRKAYKEVSSLNRAKDKVINHLSHELKTPLSVLLASMNILSKKLAPLPHETWRRTMDRANRNLNRILEIQYEVEDIMKNRDYRAHRLLSHLLGECADELEVLAIQELGEGDVVQKIRDKIDNIFGPFEIVPVEIEMGSFFRQELEELKPYFTHRHVDISAVIEENAVIKIPAEVLRKIFGGLIRNAVENCPDHCLIEVALKKKGKGYELRVKDYGIGIHEDMQRRVFEGFFSTVETMNYSSKRPYDFNAGGKGADLLRMKIFSERYNFKIGMESVRCSHIPGENDVCPGDIDKCAFCRERKECLDSGGTTFILFFPE